MCRSIKVLREGATPAPTEEIEAAALQFVRKISGFSKPAQHNEAVFHQAPFGIQSGWSTYEMAMSEALQNIR